jgi:predicted TPR repeat methyltransferase
MSDTYRDSHKAEGYGASYDKEFQNNPHRALIWQIERRVLDRIAARFLAGRRIRHLDFACGTGRVLAHLRSRAGESVGVDVSESMLKVAREKAPGARLLLADLTRDDVLNGETFDLITAFRFFPNAEPALRRQAADAIVKHLAPGGYLVFNNHKNDSSAMHYVARLLGRGGQGGVPQSDVDDLVRTVGLKIVKTYGIGLMPATEKHPLLPGRLLGVIERAATAGGVLKSLTQDLIFVCARSG